MKKYELTVLIHPDLEMNLAPTLEKLKELIESSGGKIAKEVNEGKKKLAYKIQKQDFAVYEFFELELPAAAPARISSVLNITEEVLRYLLVAQDERKIKLEAKRNERKPEKKELNEE